MRGWGFVSAASRACEGIRSHSNLSFSASSPNKRRDIQIRSCSEMYLYIYKYCMHIYMYSIGLSLSMGPIQSGKPHLFPEFLSSLLQLQLLLSTLQMLLLYANKICCTWHKHTKIPLDRQTHATIFTQQCYSSFGVLRYSKGLGAN